MCLVRDGVIPGSKVNGRISIMTNLDVEIKYKSAPFLFLPPRSCWVMCGSIMLTAVSVRKPWVWEENGCGSFRASMKQNMSELSLAVRALTRFLYIFLQPLDNDFDKSHSVGGE